MKLAANPMAATWTTLTRKILARMCLLTRTRLQLLQIPKMSLGCLQTVITPTKR